MAPKGKARAKGKATEAAEAVLIPEESEESESEPFPDTLEDGSPLATIQLSQDRQPEETEAWHPPQPPHQDFSSFVLVFRFWYCLSLGTSLGSGIFYL